MPGAAPDTALNGDSSGDSRRFIRSTKAGGVSPPGRRVHCTARNALRYKGLLIARTVNDDRHQEGLLLGHMVCTFDGELPFVAKIALEPLLGVPGDNRNEEGAVVDLVPDLLIPRVPAPQLALIEKDLDAGRTQCLANLLGRLRILRGVAQKYRV